MFGLLHGMLRNRGKEKADIVEGDILEIAFGMSQDYACAVAASDDVANDHIADRANGLHGEFGHTGMDLAATFDVEVQSFSVPPPEPVVELGLDRQVRQDDITHIPVVKIHE